MFFLISQMTVTDDQLTHSLYKRQCMDQLLYWYFKTFTQVWLLGNFYNTVCVCVCVCLCVCRAGGQGRGGGFHCCSQPKWKQQPIRAEPTHIHCCWEQDKPTPRRYTHAHKYIYTLLVLLEVRRQNDVGYPVNFQNKTLSRTLQHSTVWTVIKKHT